jgi:hypothetical protein
MGTKIDQTMQKSFFTHPTKRTLIVFTILWFVGVSLSILAATDLFTESLFKSGNLFYHGSILAPSLVVLKLYLNYYKNE